MWREERRTRSAERAKKKNRFTRDLCYYSSVGDPYDGFNL
jgi:hypothetical protein